jgi:hypothetical protein
VFNTKVYSNPEMLMQAWDRLVHSRRNWLRLPERCEGLGSVVDFLALIAESQEVLFHGSNSRTIEVFEPREQTTFHGELVIAVFATPDPIWPLFFAVTDTAAVGSRWNTCALPRRSGGSTRYFFSVGTHDQDFWTDGAIYLLPKSAFRPSDDPSEWIAFDPVHPLAVVAVKPTDFPFKDKVFPHRTAEPEWRKVLRLAVNRRPRHTRSSA